MQVVATELYRALACNGSRALVDQIPPSAPTEQSEDAREGTAAHFVGSSVLSGKISDPLEYVDRKMPNGIYVTPEMAEFVDKYTAAILLRDGFEDFVETDTTYAFQAPFGTVTIPGRSDHIGWNPDIDELRIDDFKYGWRIVEPEENWAMIAYAIGHCIRFGIRPSRIVFTVYQPRPRHEYGPAREWELSFDELMAYHAAICEKLSHPNNTLITGDHCHGCPALAYCPAARAAGLNSIEAVAIAKVAESLSDEEVSYELLNLERAVEMAEDRIAALKEMGKHRIEAGRIINGYAVVATYGRETFRKDFDVATYVKTVTGIDISVAKTLTPKQAIKAGVNPAVIAGLTDTPFTGVRLIRADANKRGKLLFETK